MPLSLNTNLAALNAQRRQTTSQNALGVAVARLSSGLRINSAKDDAAGLAIAGRFRSQIEGTNQAGRNANDGISLAQTAEGALASVSNDLQRIRELAVQSANATHSASDRASLQLEVAQLQSEIDRVATQTKFNGVNLLDGSFAASAFQVGASAGQTIDVAQLASARATALGTYRGFSGNLAMGLPADPMHFFAQNPLSVTIGGGAAIQLGNVTTDSRSIAAAINAAGIQGLGATAKPSGCDAGTSTANATASGTAVLVIQGVAINLPGLAGAQNLAGNRAAAIQAINAQSAVTGVVATDTGSGVLTTAVDGRLLFYDFSAGSFTGSDYSDFGLTNSQFSGGIDLEYAAPPGVTGSISFAQPDGFNSTAAIGSAGTAVRDLDVSTAAGANAALGALDRALASIANERASLGAVHNRFASTIGTLQAAGANLVASRSRIEDADFAVEAANLSRAQVLQQAGTAMIAQANQLPQGVLALLKSN